MAARLRASRVTDRSTQVALVTGGTRGIGQAIAASFLDADATVVICGRSPPEKTIAANGRTADFVQTDIRDFDQVEHLIAFIEERYGHLDVLINNAGGSPTVDPASASPRFSEAIVRLNLLAPLFVSQSAYRLMRNQETGGVIINIASIAATRPSPNVAAYAAAKAGLLSLTSSLAVAWAPKVRVNAIIGGTIRTEQIELHYSEAGERRMNAIIPAGRLGEAKDIAEACLFLASGRADYISGASLAVHGGGERPAFLDAAEAPMTDL
jgi:NAD(P)-dependent dehydrogenase (short-subunit alcohol dehydrogenase family)